MTMKRLAGAALPAVQVLAAVAAVAGLYLLAGLAWTLLAVGVLVLAATTAVELLPLLRRPGPSANRPVPHVTRTRAGLR
ncbi:hypothetical protein AB0M02_44195 [Actinoplanes sp. NPDC051861]|uniref:hypothetical protein n=1 Tax=Actinoplanes sp. NPDC051861 TaxID=3155170 RepID=UPI003412E4FD